MTPQVSVITTCYNYARYIGDLAKSISIQDVPLEWIVVDDASTDSPWKVLKPYAKSIDIKFIRQPENRGYSIGKNIGIRKACTEYLCMIDADDVLLPASLACRLEALKAHPDKLWVHAEAWDLTPGGSIEKPYPTNNRRRFEQFRAEGKDLTKWYTHRLIHAQTVMVRRAFHERLGLYDETLRFSSDNEMWRRAIRFGVIPLYLEQAVSLYRTHGQRMSRSSYKKQRIEAVKEYIIRVVEQRYREGVHSGNTPILEKA